ncbi:pentapeptide repeat-containing protein [Streptomyces olivaceus]|uniref:pentapeptide repeat-containing protein n=1 Tax=Streptomyces olivaceus TaxID=47716 RepID=UPI0036B0C487
MQKRAPMLAAGAVVTILLLGTFVILLWKGPWWADGGHFGQGLTPGEGAVVTGFRTTIVAFGAGILAAGSLAYTHLNHRQAREAHNQSQENFTEQAELTRDSLRQSEINAARQAEISREGQVTERYVAAIHLIASENKTEQLGGIYSLERIMRDSVKDHNTVVEVLAAFIRQHAQEPSDESAYPRDTVQAALDVLARRPEREEPFVIDLRRVSLHDCTVRDANLREVNFYAAKFTRVVFQACNLSHADMMNASIEVCRFSKCDLTEVELDHSTITNTSFLAGAAPRLSAVFATFTSCRFNHMNLEGAYFESASLHRVHFRGSELSRADFGDACLYGSHFSNRSKLMLNLLLGSYIFSTTTLPENLRENVEVKARIRQVEQNWDDGIQHGHTVNSDQV